MTQAVCPPPADASGCDRSEAIAESAAEATRSSIQSRWQDSPRIDVRHDRGYPVLDLGSKEIWDGSDLALLRETLARLVERDGVTRIGVDMSYVKYVPSGFFGMLFDWSEQGAAIHLDDPCQRVRQMIWFRQFLAPISDTRFRLETEALHPVSLGVGDDSEWDAEVETDHELPQLVTSSTDSLPMLGL